MKATLSATEKELSDLRSSLSSRIAKAIDRGGSHYRFESMPEHGGSVTFELRCSEDRYIEFASDDCGQELQVTPFANGRGWRALLGVSISWRRLKQRQREFHNAQIISFLQSMETGSDFLDGPIQFMRLEWEALDRNNNFNGPVAHPHWQIDIGRHAMRRQIGPPTLEVNSQIPSAVRDEGLPWLSKIHLAASGRWMERPWVDEELPAPHVSGPQTTEQLSDWVVSACRYIHHQTNEALGE